MDALITNGENMITYSRLLLKCDTFTSRLHGKFIQASLIKYLIDRTFKINNTWKSFHKDLTNIKEVLKRKSYHFILIDKFFQKYL